MGLTDVRSVWVTLRFGLIYADSAVILLASRLWQSFWPLFSILFAFVALAAMGAFANLGKTAHWLALLPFIAGGLWYFAQGAATFRWPRRGDVEQAMEQAAKLAHRPLLTLRDNLANTDNSETADLWHLHRRRLAATKAQVKRARFHTTVAREDRFSLRHMAGLLLVIGLVIGAKETLPRVQQAMRPGLPMMAAATPPALDIWITPPDYTRLAPSYLARANNASAALTPEPRVPLQSIVKIRLSGYRYAPYIRYGGERIAATRVGARNFTAEFAPKKDGALTVRQGLRRLGSWNIALIADTPPKISLLDATPSGNGQLKITWQAGDDYGLKTITATVHTPAGIGGLIEGQPDTIVDLPPPATPEPGKQQDGVSSFMADLSGHPMAGRAVVLHLTATDAEGQTTQTEPLDVFLPERRFTSATAQELVTERKRLLFYGDHPFTVPLVSNGLLTIANQPPLYRDDRLVFLSLVSALKRIGYDGGRPALKCVSALLWDVALRVEDGGVSEAGRDLQQALAALSAALNDPAASQEAIQELLGDVQDALGEYMQAMANEMQQRQQKTAQMPPEIAEKVMQKIDIDAFMQELREMANGDNRDRMRQMTEMLRNAMANMDMDAMARMQESQQQAMQALSDLADVIRGQQELIDAMGAGDAAHEDMQDIADRQQELNRKLSALRGNLGPLAGQMSGQMDTAGGEMSNAEKNLRGGQGQAALDAQRAALKALTAAQDQAMDQLAKAMQQMMMLGMGGSGQPNGGYGEGYDPLGRPKDGGKGIGGEIGLPSEGERRRVQDIQRELRDRYNDGERPRNERDYLERLLDLFK